MCAMRLILFVLLSIVCGVTKGSFINNEVTQTITATSHILQIDASITVDLPDALSEPYIYHIEPELANRLSFIEAKVNVSVLSTHLF